MSLSFKNFDKSGPDEPEPEPVYCWFLDRTVPCRDIEVWCAASDGHVRALDEHGDPLWVPWNASVAELEALPLTPGTYVFIARDRRGRIRGRAEASKRRRGPPPPEPPPMREADVLRHALAAGRPRSLGCNAR